MSLTESRYSSHGHSQGGNAGTTITLCGNAPPRSTIVPHHIRKSPVLPSSKKPEIRGYVVAVN